MSDFDKEAERERLREKYEQEQADREATEKMSELLLQGATMTNAHCQDCGDPIFRYDGQEFCATCEKTVERSSGGDEADADADGQDSDNIEVADPSEGTRVQFGGGEAQDDGAADVTDATEPTADAGTGTDAAEGAQSTSTAAREAASDTRPPRRAPPSQSSARREAATAGGDENLHAARASLERTLATLTSQAEACDDPRDAEAYLAAAREAAETLAALRR